MCCCSSFYCFFKNDSATSLGIFSDIRANLNLSEVVSISFANSALFLFAIPSNFSKCLINSLWMYSLVFDNKKSFGNFKVLPYTNSAGEHCKSCLYVVRNANRIIGKYSDQFLFSYVLLAVFSVLWNLSIKPLHCGWYAVVLVCFIPNNLFITANNLDSNCLWTTVCSYIFWYSVVVQEFFCDRFRCHIMHWNCSCTSCIKYNDQCMSSNI